MGGKRLADSTKVVDSEFQRRNFQKTNFDIEISISFPPLICPFRARRNSRRLSRDTFLDVLRGYHEKWGTFVTQKDKTENRLKGRFCRGFAGLSLAQCCPQIGKG